MSRKKRPLPIDHSRRRFLGAVGAAVLQSSLVGTAHGDELPVSGIEQPALGSFDELMRDFVREQKVTGAALAVTRQGRLVYARGFGLADRESDQPVEPTSLFRIASLSKLVTSAAIWQLMERQKLDQGSKICQVLNLHETKDRRWQEVTLEQLMQHTGGWNRDKSFDPMFRSVKIAKAENVPPPAMPAQIIRYMTGEPLDFDPGTRYAYSNFGYSLLGRAIEHASGAKYGEYVRREVLKPLGIHNMQLGATLLKNRRLHEVRYYDRKDRTAPAVMGEVGEKVPLPYGTWCLEAMDAHGGWISSAVDLVRFASAFDKPQQSRILKAASIEQIFARPDGLAGHKPNGEPKQVYYG
jgi:N-acyl-D-amino-acid deacylase